MNLLLSCCCCLLPGMLAVLHSLSQAEAPSLPRKCVVLLLSWQRPSVVPVPWTRGSIGELCCICDYFCWHF